MRARKGGRAPTLDARDSLGVAPGGSDADSTPGSAQDNLLGARRSPGSQAQLEVKASPHHRCATDRRLLPPDRQDEPAALPPRETHEAGVVTKRPGEPRGSGK